MQKKNLQTLQPPAVYLMSRVNHLLPTDLLLVRPNGFLQAKILFGRLIHFH